MSRPIGANDTTRRPPLNRSLIHRGPMTTDIAIGWRPAGTNSYPAKAGVTVWHVDRVHGVADMARVIHVITGAMAAAGHHEKEIFRVHLALEEAIVNAHKHGHRGDWGTPIAVRYYVSAEGTVGAGGGPGTGFDPAAVPDPLAPENLERPTGRGLLLMRTYLSGVCHNQQGNCICLCKHLAGLHARAAAARRPVRVTAGRTANAAAMFPASGTKVVPQKRRVPLPYSAEISRLNPTALVFLLDESGSMVEPFGAQPEKRKADGVADAINRLLQNIVSEVREGGWHSRLLPRRNGQLRQPGAVRLPRPPGRRNPGPRQQARRQSPAGGNAVAHGR